MVDAGTAWRWARGLCLATPAPVGLHPLPQTRASAGHQQYGLQRSSLISGPMQPIYKHSGSISRRIVQICLICGHACTAGLSTPALGSGTAVSGAGL